MAMRNDPTAADPSRYPAEYYKQSVREYGQTYGGDTTSYIGGSGLGFGLAGDGSLIGYSQLQNQKASDPGISSALEVLEKLVAKFVQHSYELEDALGLGGLEPADQGSSIQSAPSLVTRIQNLGLRVDSANYRVLKSVNHLRS